MNCQPSFRTGSVPLVGPVLDELGWPRPELGQGMLASGAAGQKQPQRRVPNCDIVDVGARAIRREEPVDVRDLAYRADGRGPVEPSASTTRRNYTRPLVALLILQITAVGGLYLKKRYAEAQVIVIPATVNERSVIT